MMTKNTDMNEMEYLDKRQDTFVELYSSHEPQIRAFLRSLLPTAQDAEEVLQEVSVIIWKKFDRFDVSTDFMRWVYVIARLEALKYRRKHARSKLVFQDEVYNLMADEGAEESDKRKNELNALQQCLKTLPDNQRSLIDTVYEQKTPVVDLAEKLKTTVSSLYMKLTRTRKALYKCIKQRVAGGAV